MIKNFKCKETAKIFAGEYSKKFPSDIQRIAWRKLRIMNRLEKLEQFRILPSNHLEKLTGRRKGQYSIRVNKQWRLCFKWKDGESFDVEMVDYH